MTGSEESKFNELIYLMERNYPHFNTTFSACPTDGCSNSARGSGLCPDCYEFELGKLVGSDIAEKLHNNIKERAELIARARKFEFSKVF